ncbi:helix-turn-helix transcriptional regulator [Nocardioides sp. AN3]
MVAEVLERSIAQGVARLRRETGVDMAFGGSSEPRRAMSVVLRSFDGNLGRTLRDLRVDVGRGLGGRALALAKPVGVSTYLDARSIDHTYDGAVSPERIQSVVAVPIMVEGRPHGLLYLAARQVTDFGSALVGRALAVARDVERDVLVEVAVQRRLAEATSVLEDRAPVGALVDVAAELRRVIETTSDEAARDRLEALSERLTALVGGRPSVERPLRRGLTQREVQVLEIVGRGGTNAQVALELGLRAETAKAYLKSASRKLGARNRVHAVHLARAAGLIA